MVQSPCRSNSLSISIPISLLDTMQQALSLFVSACFHPKDRGVKVRMFVAPHEITTSSSSSSSSSSSYSLSLCLFSFSSSETKTKLCWLGRGRASRRYKTTLFVSSRLESRYLTGPNEVDAWKNDSYVLQCRIIRNISSFFKGIILLL